ncbi:hypothetical protein [Paraburkholderia sp. FT54]|uniref:hypothetical protein n=1 Tax=Paraburkholderia sp. FT54 TaxID=3074437 RepID=UPI0038F7C76B
MLNQPGEHDAPSTAKPGKLLLSPADHTLILIDNVAMGVRLEVDRSDSAAQQCRAGCEGFLRFDHPDHGGIEDLLGFDPSSGNTERISSKRVATIVDGSIVRVGR